MRTTSPLSTWPLWLPPSLMLFLAAHISQPNSFSYEKMWITSPLLCAVLAVGLIAAAAVQQNWIHGDEPRWRRVAVIANVGTLLVLLTAGVYRNQAIPVWVINSSDGCIMEARYISSTQEDRMVFPPGQDNLELTLLGHDRDSLQVHLKVSTGRGEYWEQAAGSQLELRGRGSRSDPDWQYRELVPLRAMPKADFY